MAKSSSQGQCSARRSRALHILVVVVAEDRGENVVMAVAVGGQNVVASVASVLPCIWIDDSSRIVYHDEASYSAADSSADHSIHVEVGGAAAGRYRARQFTVLVVADDGGENVVLAVVIDVFLVVAGDGESVTLAVAFVLDFSIIDDPAWIVSDDGATLSAADSDDDHKAWFALGGAAARRYRAIDSIVLEVADGGGESAVWSIASTLDPASIDDPAWIVFDGVTACSAADSGDDHFTQMEVGGAAAWRYRALQFIVFVLVPDGGENVVMAVAVGGENVVLAVVVDVVLGVAVSGEDIVPVVGARVDPGFTGWSNAATFDSAILAARPGLVHLPSTTARGVVSVQRDQFVADQRRQVLP